MLSMNQSDTRDSEKKRHFHKSRLSLCVLYSFLSKGPWLDEGQRILEKLNLPLKFTDLTIDRRTILYNKICQHSGNIKAIRAWCNFGTRIQKGHKTLLDSFRENVIEGNEVSIFLDGSEFNLFFHKSSLVARRLLTRFRDEKLPRCF